MFLDVLEMTTSYVQYLYLLIRIAPSDYPDFFTEPFIIAAYFVLDWLNNTTNSSGGGSGHGGGGSDTLIFSSSNSINIISSSSSSKSHNVKGNVGVHAPVSTLVTLPSWLPTDYRLQFVAISVLTPLCISTLGYLCVSNTRSYLYLLLLLVCLFLLVFGSSLLAGHYPQASYELVPSSMRTAMFALGVPCSVVVVVALTYNTWRLRRAQYARRERLLRCVTHEEQRERASRATVDRVIDRENISLAALALHRVQLRRRAMALRRVRWRDVFVQTVCALLLLVLALMLTGVLPLPSVAQLQQQIIFRVPGIVVLVAGLSCVVWVLLSLSRRGRVVCRWLRELVSRYLLVLLTFALSFLYTTMVTNFVSVLYCYTATCAPGTRIRPHNSVFPAVLPGGSSSVFDDDVGVRYSCIALDVPAHAQQCPRPLQQSLLTQSQRTRWLVYDSTVPCEAIDTKFRFCAGFVFGGYVLLIPCLQLLLARYARHVLRWEYPLERRFVDALTPHEQYSLKVKMSDNPAESVFRAYKPQYSYYSMSFMAQKLVLAVVSFIAQRGVRKQRAWVAQTIFAVVAATATTSALLCRPFARPTEAAYFPALQLMVMVTALYGVLAHFAHDAVVTGPLGVLLAVLLVSVPVVTLVAATIRTLRGHREREERLRRRLAQRLAFDQYDGNNNNNNNNKGVGLSSRGGGGVVGAGALCAQEVCSARHADDLSSKGADGGAMTRPPLSPQQQQQQQQRTTSRARRLVGAPLRVAQRAARRLEYVLCVIMATPDAFASTATMTTTLQQQQQQHNNVAVLHDRHGCDHRHDPTCDEISPTYAAQAHNALAAYTAAANAAAERSRNEESMCSVSHVSVPVAHPAGATRVPAMAPLSASSSPMSAAAAAATTTTCVVNDADNTSPRAADTLTARRAAATRAADAASDTDDAVSAALAEMASFEAAAAATRTAREAEVAALRRVALHSSRNAAMTTTAAAAAATTELPATAVPPMPLSPMHLMRTAAPPCCSGNNNNNNNCASAAQQQRQRNSLSLTLVSNSRVDGNTAEAAAAAAAEQQTVQPNSEYDMHGYVFVPALYFARAHRSASTARQPRKPSRWRGRRASMTDITSASPTATPPHAKKSGTSAAAATAAAAAAHAVANTSLSLSISAAAAAAAARTTTMTTPSPLSHEHEQQQQHMSTLALNADSHMSSHSIYSVATQRATMFVQHNNNNNEGDDDNNRNDTGSRGSAQLHAVQQNAAKQAAPMHFTFPTETMDTTSSSSTTTTRNTNNHHLGSNNNDSTAQSQQRQRGGHGSSSSTAEATAVRTVNVPHGRQRQHGRRRSGGGVDAVGGRSSAPSRLSRVLRGCRRGVRCVARGVMCCARRAVLASARAVGGTLQCVWRRLLTVTEHRQSGNAVVNTHAHVLTFADVCARRRAAAATAAAHVDKQGNNNSSSQVTAATAAVSALHDGAVASPRLHSCTQTASLRRVRHVHGHESPLSLYKRTASTLQQLRLRGTKEHHGGLVAAALATAAAATTTVTPPTAALDVAVTRTQQQQQQQQQQPATAPVLDVTPYVTCARERLADIRRYYGVSSSATIAAAAAAAATARGSGNNGNAYNGAHAAADNRPRLLSMTLDHVFAEHDALCDNLRRQQEQEQHSKKKKSKKKKSSSNSNNNKADNSNSSMLPYGSRHSDPAVSPVTVALHRRHSLPSLLRGELDLSTPRAARTHNHSDNNNCSNNNVDGSVSGSSGGGGISRAATDALLGSHRTRQQRHGGGGGHRHRRSQRHSPHTRRPPGHRHPSHAHTPSPSLSALRLGNTDILQLTCEVTRYTAAAAATTTTTATATTTIGIGAKLPPPPPPPLPPRMLLLPNKQRQMATSVTQPPCGTAAAAAAAAAMASSSPASRSLSLLPRGTTMSTSPTPSALASNDAAAAAINNNNNTTMAAIVATASASLLSGDGHVANPLASRSVSRLHAHGSGSAYEYAARHRTALPPHSQQQQQHSATVSSTFASPAARVLRLQQRQPSSHNNGADSGADEEDTNRAAAAAALVPYTNQRHTAMSSSVSLLSLASVTSSMLMSLDDDDDDDEEAAAHSPPSRLSSMSPAATAANANGGGAHTRGRAAQSMHYGGSASHASAIASIMSAPVLPPRHARRRDSDVARRRRAKEKKKQQQAMATRMRVEGGDVHNAHKRGDHDEDNKHVTDDNANDAAAATSAGQSPQTIVLRNSDAAALVMTTTAVHDLHDIVAAGTADKGDDDDDDDSSVGSDDNDSSDSRSSDNSSDSDSDSSSVSDDEDEDDGGGSVVSVDTATAQEQMRYYCLLREQLSREYWRDRERLLAVQQSVDTKIYRFSQHALQLFLVALACLSCAAFALAVSSSLATLDMDTFRSATRLQPATLTHELAGYVSWSAFVAHCCCAAVTNMTPVAPLYALDAEHWVCDNGIRKERVRRDALVTAAATQEQAAVVRHVYDGYAVRPLCGLQFASGCELQVHVDDEEQQRGTVQIACKNATLTPAELQRW